jgi:hypothetical protein
MLLKNILTLLISKRLFELIVRIHLHTGAPCGATLYALAIFRKLWKNGRNFCVALTKQRNYDYEDFMELDVRECLIAETYYWSLWVSSATTIEKDNTSWLVTFTLAEDLES